MATTDNKENAIVEKSIDATTFSSEQLMAALLSPDSDSLVANAYNNAETPQIVHEAIDEKLVDAVRNNLSQETSHLLDTISEKVKIIDEKMAKQKDGGSSTGTSERSSSGSSSIFSSSQPSSSSPNTSSSSPSGVRWGGTSTQTKTEAEKKREADAKFANNAVKFGFAISDSFSDKSDIARPPDKRMLQKVLPIGSKSRELFFSVALLGVYTTYNLYLITSGIKLRGIFFDAK